MKGERKEERENECKKRKSKCEEIGRQENSGGEMGGGPRAISLLNKERMGEGVIKSTNGRAPGSGKIDCVIGSGSHPLIHSFVRSLLFRQVKCSPVCLSLLCPQV